MEPDSARPSCAHAEENARLHRELARTRGELEGLRRALAEATAGGADHNGVVPAPLEPRPTGAVGTSLPDGGRGTHVDQGSSRRAKLALYRTLFAGRGDVYARRFENRTKGTSGWWPVHTGGPSIPRDQRQYLPLTDEVITAHLEGHETIGLYPLLPGDTCRLLACDFDKATWRLDVQAYCQAAEAAGVPTAVELSRSGDGAHVWTFFTAPVAAADARAMGAALLREAIALRGELDLDSYDRFFPSQDHLPERGFGNLIALPLQGQCRRQRHTTVFVDPPTLEPWPDQFAFMDCVQRLSPADVRRITEDLRPLVVGPQARLHRSTLRADPDPPATVPAQLAGMLAIRRAGIPPGLYASLKHLAVLHNPAFHKNERLRMSNHATPRFIRCYAEDLEHLYLPRGVTEAAAALVAEAGSRLEIHDLRSEPAPLQVTFTGALRELQTEAVDELARHELGVLEAPPGAGKTVMGCALIARHATPTLVLVDRRELLDQWRAQLRTHLGIHAGQIGAGKRTQTRAVDIATFQTVVRSQHPDELLDGYGLVVIDECHRVAAPTIERTVREVRARRWLGLTATPQRPDGLNDVMVMQCGPIRHRIDQVDDHLVRLLHVHDTQLAVDMPTDGLTRGEVLALLYESIVDDARYIGEGFDCPRLDTLFLAFPVSAPQRIEQYAGRVVRAHPGKDTAEVHDYRDAGVPMLKAMYNRRKAGYRKLRFATDPTAASAPRLPLPAASRPPAAQPKAPAEGAAPSATTAAVRAWARTAGFAVGDRGRLPGEVWQAYRTAHI